MTLRKAMACTSHLKIESRFGKEEAMGNSIITLENINKHYGKHEVLKGVNLEIKKGLYHGEFSINKPEEFVSELENLLN